MSFATYAGGNRNPRNIVLEEELLERIGPYLCIDQVLDKKPVPMKQGDTFAWQRAIVPTTLIAEVTEGVNPAGRTLAYELITKVAQEFAESMSCSSREAELGQTDILKDQADVLGDLVAATRENLGWVGCYGGSNVIYNSVAITSRVTVNGAITGGRIETALRLLKANKAKPFYEMTKGALEDNTTPVEEGYVCLAHTDAEADIRLLPGFRPAPEMGGAKLPKGCFGVWRKVYFITSPEFKPLQGAGAAVGTTGLKSVGGTNVDVYPYVFMGRKAVGRIGLKGMGKGGFGGVKAYTITGADHADTTGQRMVNAVRYYDGVVVLQDAHLIRIECGVTANPIA